MPLFRVQQGHLVLAGRAGRAKRHRRRSLSVASYQVSRYQLRDINCQRSTAVSDVCQIMFDFLCKMLSTVIRRLVGSSKRQTETVTPGIKYETEGKTPQVSTKTNISKTRQLPKVDSKARDSYQCLQHTVYITTTWCEEELLGVLWKRPAEAERESWSCSSLRFEDRNHNNFLVVGCRLGVPGTSTR